MPVKDENGRWTTYRELAKRYRMELEGRSRFYKTKWWDQIKEAERQENRRKHRPL